MFEKFIDKQYNYALVGASENENKYGFIVFKYLLDHGFCVFPVNPKAGIILNKKVYKNLDEIDRDIDVVVFITPPKITKQILQSFPKLGINKAWFQPGSQDDEVIQICDNLNIDTVTDNCIMVENEKIINKL